MKTFYEYTRHEAKNLFGAMLFAVALPVVLWLTSQRTGAQAFSLFIWFTLMNFAIWQLKSLGKWLVYHADRRNWERSLVNMYELYARETFASHIGAAYHDEIVSLQRLGEKRGYIKVIK